MLLDFLTPDIGPEYKSRVMILIQRRLCIVSSGISVYLKGLIRTLPADVLLEVHYVGPEPIVPEGPYKASNVRMYHHKATRVGLSLSVMGVESLRYDLINDYRRAIHSHCFGKKTYDAILTTDPEGALAASSLGRYAEAFNSVFVTHHGTMFGAREIPNDANACYFSNEVIPKLDNIRSFTQTWANKDYLKKSHGVDVEDLALIPAEELSFTYEADKREGCLFIGRFEKNKRPELFIKTMAETGIKPVVITGGKNAKEKWEKAFKDAGIANYSLSIRVEGEEKAKIIGSARFGFVGSYNESFGFNSLEILHSCPLMIVDEPFSVFWEDMGATRFKIGDAAETAKRLNETKDYRPSDKLVENQRHAIARWHEVLSIYTGKVPKDTAKVLTLLTNDAWTTVPDIIKAYGVETLMPHEYAALKVYCDTRHTEKETLWKLK